VRSRGHAVYSLSLGSAEREKFAKTPAGAVFQLARRTCSQQHRRIRLTSRGFHTATLLPNGQVVVAAGFSGSGRTFTVIASAELYTP